ncbi:MAG: aldolase [Burkholderiales bacterium]|nr:aldolase [Burkholderiales bacterium]
MDLHATLRAGVTTGTFVKTAHPQVVEVLGTAGLPFAVIDAEHAPFDRNTLDLMLLAGRAAALPLLVRIPDKAAPTILQVLDLGAAGLVVPHVNSADEARAVVSRARYRGGERGFSGSPRFAGYGALGMQAALAAGDRSVVMCQIESRDGLANARAIAAVPGVDALFIGRADLALALGHEDIRAAAVTAATQAIIDAARAENKIAAMFVPNLAEREQFRAAGVSCFVVGSDQSFLRQGALALAPSR